MHLHRQLQFTLLAGLLGAACAAHAGPTYRVGAMTPNMTVYALNDPGDLVGETAFQDRALLYSNGMLTDLGNLGGAPSAAYGINNAGAIVGVSRIDPASADRAFLYRNGSMRDLGTLGGPRSIAFDINNAGRVVGMSTFENGDTQAFIYEHGAMSSFGAPPRSVANAINERGDIAGNATVGPPGGGAGTNFSHPFLYQGGVVIDLSGALGRDSSAEDLNDHGQVAGTIFDASRSAGAFIYDKGAVTRIGTLGGEISVGRGINNAGQVVGWSEVSPGINHGFLYSDGKLVDLGALLDPALGWEINEGNAINELGQISGHGCNRAGCFALRLDPIAAIPEPAACLMLAGGLGVLGIGARWRRRLARRAAPATWGPPGDGK